MFLLRDLGFRGVSSQPGSGFPGDREATCQFCTGWLASRANCSGTRWAQAGFPATSPGRPHAALSPRLYVGLWRGSRQQPRFVPSSLPSGRLPPSWASPAPPHPTPGQGRAAASSPPCRLPPSAGKALRVSYSVLPPGWPEHETAPSQGPGRCSRRPAPWPVVRRGAGQQGPPNAVHPTVHL